MQPIGTLALLMIGIYSDWLPAEGQCLNKFEYYSLAEVLHEGDYWPYGKCDEGFRIPDLRSKPTQDSERYKHQWMIKVK
jgi:hypothetical protein